MDATDKPNGSPRAAGRTSRTSSRASNCSKRGVSQGGPSRHRPEYQVNSGNLGWCLAGFDVFFFGCPSSDMTTKIHKARRVMPTSQKRFGPENDDRDDDDDVVVDDDDIAGFSGYGIAWQGQQLRRGK